MRNPGEEGRQLLEFYMASAVVPAEAWSPVVSQSTLIK